MNTCLSGWSVSNMSSSLSPQYGYGGSLPVTLSYLLIRLRLGQTVAFLHEGNVMDAALRTT